MRAFLIWLAALVGVAYGLGWVATAGQFVPVWPGLLYILIAAAITAPLFPRWARK